ncbi:MAG TPA: endonuclease Q family protein [Candidatus Paceibacterota bacterium]|nr:endonuclease Q family protein [Candidatus Paceibacterota bacterium]
MKIIADFHIHSKYSRATSSKMDLEHIYLYAKRKGINIVGTGDFTHPQWLKEIQEKLIPAEDGLYRLKPDLLDNLKDLLFDKKDNLRFIISGEISNIYAKNGKTRRLHNLILLPSIESAEKINHLLSLQGNLKSDGRPILGMDSLELLKIVYETEKNSMFIPAHIWTPWFSLFGSMSGFDSLEEAFGKYSNYLTALETGLSSDPKMNWRLSMLDRYSLVSNSDAHSPDNLGREANIFDIDLSYSQIKKALIEKDKNKFLSTIEFFPEEGKYHYDGHRLCQVRLSPAERKKINGICPVCHRPLTVGVLSRVEELADREEGIIPPTAIPFKSLIPLKEIIADVLNVNPHTKSVENIYLKLLQQFNNEFHLLLDVPIEEISKLAGEKIALAISNMREGKVEIEPGYDGEYGKIKIPLRAKTREQNSLF